MRVWISAVGESGGYAAREPDGFEHLRNGVECGVDGRCERAPIGLADGAA